MPFEMIEYLSKRNFQLKALALKHSLSSFEFEKLSGTHE